MSLFDKLTAKNFSAFAMKHYDDPQCESLDDFQDDLRRFRYLKRLLYRYHEFGESRERVLMSVMLSVGAELRTISKVSVAPSITSVEPPDSVMV